MDKQPEALRLADKLDQTCDYNTSVAQEAADELRRLHEEIKCEERRFSDLWEQFAALDKKNQELVEALEGCLVWHDPLNSGHYPAEKRIAYMQARAALAKEQGEKE